MRTADVRMMHRSSTRRSRAEQALLSRAATQHALLTGVVADSAWYSAHDPALMREGKTADADVPVRQNRRVQVPDRPDIWSGP